MDIFEATARYEAWLARHTPLTRAELAVKHAAMRRNAFVFLRATCYRWAQVFETLNPALARAPRVLGVGDLHVENFGTWRDAEGRLIWGVNDFDEACTVPYTNDLTRLAASALLAARTENLDITAPRIARAIVDGYTQGLDSGGKPFVLEEHHDWLRAIALNHLRDPDRYWEKLEQVAPCKDTLPGKAQRLLQWKIPRGAVALRVIHRVSGLGSLGRKRWTALYEHGDSYVAREVKARAPSAWCWAQDAHGNAGDLPAVWARSRRINDPFLHATRRWIVRRLAPDCSRIELADLPRRKDVAHLLHAMARDTANIHIGSGITGKIRRHLQTLPRGWLEQATSCMVQHTRDDHRLWVSKK
jgi:uncharacterized protein (DUF2252 family)